MKKKTLYKIYGIAATALLAAAASSCDNFLDIQPVGRVIITTAEEYRKMLTEAYSIVPEDRGLATFRGDEFVLNSTVSQEDLNSYLDIWLWDDVSPESTTATFNWRSYYQVLYEANYLIESRDNITEGTTEEIDQLEGEAYMLRAYMHFLLVNLYGEPYTALADPYSSKAVPLKLDTDPYNVLSRNTVGEIYDQIISDMNRAEQLLNVEDWGEYRYRFNTLSVDALRSRVYLYMGRWEESLAASRRVLEVKSTLSDVTTELPNHYQSVENIVALEQVMTAYYDRAGKVSSELYGLYDIAGDLRRTQYFNRQTSSNITVKKGGSNEYSCSFRVGEIYLNAAEAALESSTGEDALQAARGYLLTLMQSRYTASYYASREAAVNAMSREELREEIYAERRRELAFEGHRWFDLRRTTRPQLTKTYQGATYTLEQGDSRYTIRIPSAAIEANPNLAN